MGTAPDASVGQRYQQMAPSASVHSGSPQAKLQKSQIAYDEFEEDDLESLDISDLPQSPSTFANGRLPNTIIGPPIKLIGTPLPANFVVADTLYPIAPPENEHDGRCRSKYVRSAEINEEQENIEYSKYWSDHQDDPIFAERPSDESTMSIEDALAKVKQSFVDGEVRDESTKSRSQSRSDSVRRESVDKYSALASIEQNIAEEKARLAARLAELERKKKLQNGKYKLSSQPSTPGDRQGMVKQEQQTSPQLSTSKQSWESDRDTEAVLVALGVTGSPKPVDTGPLPSYRGGPPDDNLNSTDTPHQPNDRSSSGSTPHFQGSGPRPPPFRQDFHPSGAGGSPLSAGTGYVNAQNYNANGADYTNGHSDYGADGQIQSPVGSRSEKSMSRKRSFARRDSPSDEEDTPARRQQDDITPKLKKRQPKVAEAYR